MVQKVLWPEPFYVLLSPFFLGLVFLSFPVFGGVQVAMLHYRELRAMALTAEQLDVLAEFTALAKGWSPWSAVSCWRWARVARVAAKRVCAALSNLLPN